LAELLFYFLYHFFDFWGVLAFVSLLACATYLVLFKIALRRSANFYVSIVVSTFLLLAGFVFWIPRPQSIAFLLLALLLYCLDGYALAAQPKYLYVIPFIIWLWANINASFVLGIAIVGWFFVASLLNEWFSRERSAGVLTSASLLSSSKPIGLALLASV